MMIDDLDMIKGSTHCEYFLFDWLLRCESVGAAQEDQTDAEGEHGEREQHEDDF